MMHNLNLKSFKRNFRKINMFIKHSLFSNKNDLFGRICSQPFYILMGKKNNTESKQLRKRVLRRYCSYAQVCSFNGLKSII